MQRNNIRFSNQKTENGRMDVHVCRFLFKDHNIKQFSIVDLVNVLHFLLCEYGLK